MLLNFYLSACCDIESKLTLAGNKSAAYSLEPVAVLSKVTSKIFQPKCLPKYIFYLTPIFSSKLTSLIQMTRTPQKTNCSPRGASPCPKRTYPAMSFAKVSFSTVSVFLLFPSTSYLAL
jgi:hypothetical protein